MHFYRSLKTIKALTFDLDDTLYDNVPVMMKADQELMLHLQQHAPLQTLQLAEFNAIKHGLLETEPDLYQDVVQWRIQTLQTLFALHGFLQHEVLTFADEAMNNFMYWRHQIAVPQNTFQVLDKLAEKYPLAVITNGNVDVTKVGLGHYFKFSLRGGVDGHSKPATDIFHVAAKRLGVLAENIMHVGDHLNADVEGAISSGMQSCWINIFKQNIYHMNEARVLPHVEISELAELNNLL
ncbi:5-amino-6-(5-phospho-D-ribitylamino)uracil phosphatase YigB [Zophobihabitans entericus]|uniref:5-amino-6-(5-phospho-D-ribitylamino)uracil phosphatase YigB n=1 Tax=Zophobihabitans entericus TaxID=1635327 RepID=A0A6G9IAM8_9GAMM|nr:5-amino-6-(5-phospho-D-ribitylamino)uracil phosphatase YigB [Zophobihabitans entericus]QIQ21285.1 5-amino-6-(5-phospho-D-ribitylamino)uracil phosphatase YigB [Zophobihabitans entericus]